jgi:hypothetical protein
MPKKHRNGHNPLFEGHDELPPSLQEAIDAFVLACAARRLRGQERDHSSMLIHVTRFTSVQQAVRRQVEDYVRGLRQRLTRNIGVDEVLERLQALWAHDFQPTTETVFDLAPDESGADMPAWEDIREILGDVVADIDVRMINGTAKDALDYSESSATGLKVIAIGGDKLARGLTLEGLCVSYFLRASRMYDTLMQMGRWFGYRPGYVDLCRLYTTSELSEWFGHIADAAEELREEFDLMAAAGASPREYGLKVQSHPVMMVTSRLKMRRARNLMLSFSGQLLETVVFYGGEDSGLSVRGANFRATQRLLEGLGIGEVNPVRIRPGSRQEWKGELWNSVPGAAVVEFLNSYKTHPDAHKVNSVLLAQFIEMMMASGELTDWTVVLVGGGDGPRVRFTPRLEVTSLVRKANDLDGRYAIGRLLSPRDEAIDLNEAAWAQALDFTQQAWRSDSARMQKSDLPDTPNGPAIRKVRGFGSGPIEAHPERGVLLLYAITPSKDDPPPGEHAVVGFGISFPGSNVGVKVQYAVNNVLWEQEYGASE